MKVAVIVPAYNEEKYLQGTLSKIKKVCSYDIIVANDGSKDKTKNIASKYATTIISNKHNKGKGHILRKACDHATKKYDAFILIDADGQHEPKDIPEFINKLKTNDIVFSYRKGGKQPITFRFGNYALNLITRLLFNIHIKDTQCGFRAMKSSVYNQIRWNANKYDVESEMIARSKGLKYAQIPIKIIYHDTTKGTTILDGLRIGWKMIGWRFKF